MLKGLTKKRLAPWLVLGVVLFALAARLHHLGSNPQILNRDEAALAYNAHLLQETGQDEWQKSWPLNFKSFGDYKLPGYIYALVGIFKFLPKTDSVARLPSALAGTLLALVAYFFAKNLDFSLRYRLILAGLVATCPVFIFFSRMAFEANLALFLFVIALLLLLKKHDWWSVLFSLLAIFTYNSPLLLLPFIIISLPWLRGLKQVKNWWQPVLGLSLVLLIGGYQLLAVSSQKSSITLFQDETVWRQSVLYREQFTGWQRVVLGNRYLYYLSLIGQNYLKSFSPQFLVLGQGGHPWHSVPETGHLYVLVYGLALVGIFSWLLELGMQLAKPGLRLEKKKIWLFYLLLISLLPAVITVDAPHATRSLLFFFLLLIFAVAAFKKIDRLVFRGRRHIWLWLVVILVGVETGSYLGTYFATYPQEQEPLKPGFAQVMRQVEAKYPEQEQQVAIVDPDGYQYILLAWYLKISPQQYFATNIRQQADKIGLHYGQQVGRYHFIAQEADQSEEEKVLVKWSGNKWRVEED